MTETAIIQTSDRGDRREVRAMHPYKLRQLIGEFNHLLDTGEHDNVTLDEIRRNIEAAPSPAFLLIAFRGLMSA